MRVCASLSRASDMDAAMDADMVEVRLDLLGAVPDTHGKDTLVTYRDPVDLSLLPDGYSGMIDVGEQPRPDTGLTVVGSYHDYESTPDPEWIVSKLNSMDADIRKGAFRVNRIADLASILEASKAVDGRHVLLGMGALGAVTRIRADVLGNEFSFGYVGEPTAPGQFSVSEMLALGDGCTVLGILGNPLGKSRSPAMQNAALRANGIRGAYLPLETPDLDRAEDVIRGYGIRGVNVTIPYKQAVMDHLDRIDPVAERIGAVNTVVNDGGVLTGYNTDIVGIGTALERAGIDVTDRRVAVMAARPGRACSTWTITAATSPSRQGTRRREQRLQGSSARPTGDRARCPSGCTTCWSTARPSACTPTDRTRSARRHWTTASRCSTWSTDRHRSPGRPRRPDAGSPTVRTCSPDRARPRSSCGPA